MSIAVRGSQRAPSCPTPLHCRECRRPISLDEALHTGFDLARAIPGISDRHAYCTQCATGVEILLLALRLGGPRSGRTGPTPCP